MVYTRRSIKLYGVVKFGINYEEKIGINKHHVDHNISKFNGFQNKIDPKIIGNIENLQILTQVDNIKKNKKSWTTIEELLERIENTIYK